MVTDEIVNVDVGSRKEISSLLVKVRSGFAHVDFENALLEGLPDAVPNVCMLQPGAYVWP